MTKSELWLAYIDKNPKFALEGAHITFTAKGLRQFFDRTFNHALEEGRSQARAEKSKCEKAFGRTEEKTPPPSSYDSNPFEDIFGGLFGGKR